MTSALPASGPEGRFAGMDSEALVHQSILQQMDDGVVVVDFDGRVVTFNASATRILATPAEEVIGRPFAEAFLLKSGLDVFTQTMLDAVSNQQTTERQVIAAQVDGQARLLSMVTNFLRVRDDEDQKPVGIIAVFTDITATEALRESELELGQKVRAQYDELQQAYRSVEDNNAMLETALRRVRVVQGIAGVAVLAVFLLVAVFVWDAGDVEAASLGEAAADGLVDATAPQSTITLVPKPLRTTIAVTGRLEPRNAVSVLSPAEATLRDVHVQYGDEVEKGQVLVGLDLTTVRQEYRTLRAEYIEAVKRVRELDDWENSREVTAARRSLAQTANQLEKQGHRLEETAFLLERGVIPASEHAAAEEQHESLQSDYAIALQELEAVREQGGDEAREIARLAFENLRDQIDALEAVIGDDMLRAPIDGVVLRPSVRTADGPALAEGAPLLAGDMVVQIADIATLSVGASVDELNIADVRVGQAATVTSDAMPESPLGGVVTNVSSQAQPGSRGRQALFQVTIGVDPLTDAQRRRLRLGMSVSAHIVTRDLSDALLVPIAAVRVGEGDAAAVRLRDPETGQGRVVAVRTGRTTLDEVEISDGLSAGDEVFVPFH